MTGDQRIRLLLEVSVTAEDLSFKPDLVAWKQIMP